MAPIREIEFQESERTLGLAFTQNAKLRFERESGEKLMQVFADLQRGIMGLGNIQILMWAMLEGWRMRTGSRLPSISVDEVGDMIDRMGFDVASRLVTDAMRASMPPVAEGRANPVASEPPENPTPAS